MGAITPRRTEPNKSLADLVKEALDDLGEVITVQIRLVQAKAAADLSDAVRKIGRVVIFVPLMVIGYVFTLTGLTLWLAQGIGYVRAFVIIGGANVVLGAGGFLVAARRIKTAGLLDRPKLEATKTVTDVPLPRPFLPNTQRRAS
jgi:hypothetical protein